MTASPRIEHHSISCAGIKIHYAESKPAFTSDNEHAPTLVFFHGFPEFWQTWEEQFNYFSDRFRVIAPDLPGYNLSDKPRDPAFYKVPNLIKVMSDFLQVVSPIEPVTLVAHDWGGAIAWPLAAFQPQLLERLVIINAAHPSTFTRELAHNHRQRQNSGYIHDLIAYDGVERVSADDFRFLKDMVFRNIAGDPLSPERKAQYERAWAQPGALDAMLSYYRAMPQLGEREPLDGPVGKPLDLQIPNIRIDVPTLVLWGEQDPAFVPEVLDGLETYVKDLRVIRYPDQTHWLHHEQPGQVSKEIERFIEFDRQRS